MSDPFDPHQSHGQPTHGQPTHGQPPYGQPTQPIYGQPTYGQPTYGQAPVDPSVLYGGTPPVYFQPVPPPHPQASTAMGLGLGALIGGFVFMGLPLLLGPFAWHIGAKAVREIDAQPGRWSGRSEANTGKITGIISTVFLVLSILAVIAFIVLLVTAVSSTSTNTEWQPANV